MYRCSIETVAVNSDDNTARETVYVGVYGSGGIICTHSTCLYLHIHALYIHCSYLECSIIIAAAIHGCQAKCLQ